MKLYTRFSFDLGKQQLEVSDEISSSSRVKRCPYCLYSSVDLEKHFKEVNNHGFARICPICVKGYSNVNSFQIHFDLYHRNTIMHQCQICGKANQSKSHLTRHMKRHSEHKYFTCPLCHEGFKHKSNLKDHIRRCSAKQKQQ